MTVKSENGAAKRIIASLASGEYKPRSMVFDVFGEFVRPESERISLRALTELLGLFGSSPSTVRVVVTRLRREGWLDSSRNRRETDYVVNERSRKMLDDGRRRILDRDLRPWDGTWYMVIYSVPETERHLREALRKQLSWLGFGALGPSIWVSAYDQELAIRSRFADEPSVRFDMLTCSTGSLERDHDLVRRCWDLDALNRDYQGWLDTYSPLGDEVRARTVSGPDAFQLVLMMTHDYRRFPFRDPKLPRELLPSDWCGELAHARLVELRAALRPAAAGYFADVIADRTDS